MVAEAPIGELDRARAPRMAADRRAQRSAACCIAVALAALQARRLARPLEAIARRSARARRRRLLGARGALRGAGDRRDRPGPRQQRRPDRRARRARARVLGQRLAPAADAADRAAPAARGGAAAPTTSDVAARGARRRAGRGRPARGDDRRPARPRPSGERGRADARSTSASVAHDHAARWRPRVRPRSAATLEVRRRQERAACAPRAARSGRSSTCCSTTRCATAAGPCASGLRRRPRGLAVVADEGPGIPAADRDRIFERGASHAGGTGIGLHLARALAQADSGSLLATGAPDPLRAAAAARRPIARPGPVQAAFAVP